MEPDRYTVNAFPLPQIDPVREIAYLESIVHTWLGDYDEAVSLLGLWLAANPAASAEGLGWFWEGLEGTPQYARLVGSR